MPKGDRSGPMGQGAMTGRGLGFCQGDDTPGYAKNFGNGAGMGRGQGRGFGGGRGFGFGGGRGFGFGRGLGRGNFWGGFGMAGRGMSQKDEARMLKSQAEVLKDSLRDIEQQISDLEKNEG